MRLIRDDGSASVAIGSGRAAMPASLQIGVPELP
jgi:hypothetical protein